MDLSGDHLAAVQVDPEVEVAISAAGEGTAGQRLLNAGAACGTASPALVLNEVDYDQPGADTGEFVEVDAELAEKAIVWVLQGDIADTAGQAVPDADVIADQLAAFIFRALLADQDQLDEIRAVASSPR